MIKQSDPTPEEIRERCEVIRKEWSKRQKQSRLMIHPTRWDIPSVSIEELDHETGEISQESYYN